MRAEFDAYRCPNCHTVFIEKYALRETDGTVRCPDCKHVVDYEKCCKTCANWGQGGCAHFELWVEDGDHVCDQSNAVVQKLLNFEKGPPWADCRGWKGRPQPPAKKGK